MIRSKSDLEVRRSRDRFHTKIDWLDSWHSFSFGDHYDPSNTHHGLLVVNNDDVIQPGRGFGMHPHRNMEVVTWVLSGELEHKDSTGNKGRIYPGLIQRMSAGQGIWHSEMNPSQDREVRLVQMWVLPDQEDVPPGYDQRDVSSALAKGGLVAVASGRGHPAAISIRQKGAVLWIGKLKPSESVQVPDAHFVHVYVATGSVNLEGAGELKMGDAVRLTSAGNPGLTADPNSGAEVLIWETE